VPSGSADSTACPVAAFIGARIFVNNDSCYSTDSSLLYELVELARQFDMFFLHCFIIDGESARDVLHLPPSVRLVNLGGVASGRDLYGHPLRLWRRIQRCARDGDWSVGVVVEPHLTSLLAFIACWFAQRPIIALVRGDPGGGPPAHRNRRGMRAIASRFIRRFNLLIERALAASVAIVTDSDVVLERLRRRGAEVHHLIAASVAQADIVLSSGQIWRGAGDAPMRLLFVGRLERVKDVETLLEAVHMAGKTGRQFALCIVGAGDPDYTALLHSRVEELGLSEIVQFVGPIPHGPRLYEFYQKAHALVLSSRSEGIPKVVVEAMAHGLPIVATRVGSLPRFVRSEIGILVPTADAAAFSNALVSIYDSPRLARNMSMAARQASTALLAEPVSRKLASILVEAARPPSMRFRLRFRKDLQ
jgi:glycosyltransferase involved in cell wall biosynthesis